MGSSPWSHPSPPSSHGNGSSFGPSPPARLRADPMLRLPDHRVWDSWIAIDGADYHLFFLRASRALLDPDRRHLRAGIGLALSTDLIVWHRYRPQPLLQADP